jgi:hypothetical protein
LRKHRPEWSRQLRHPRIYAYRYIHQPGNAHPKGIGIVRDGASPT